jgi:hypothetical protein
MRSGLRPVATSCNNSIYYSPFAALADARAPSESASEASNALKKADSMQENEFRGVGVLGRSGTPGECGKSVGSSPSLQCSTILPPQTWNMSMALSSTRLPIGASPWNSPKWMPRIVTQAATRSSSVITSSTVTLRGQGTRWRAYPGPARQR